MPLPLTVSCFSKIQIGFTFSVPAYPCSPGQRAVKRVYVQYARVLLNGTAYIASIPRSSVTAAIKLKQHLTACFPEELRQASTGMKKPFWILMR